jgi:hydrogenase nickel incorporation protein HypA/HybF
LDGFEMHEFSTAVNIVESVKKAAQSYGANRVLTINLQIGKLSMLNHDQLLFGIEIASKGTIVEGAKVSINPLPTKIICKKCGKESSMQEEGSLYEILSSLACPHCGTKTVDITQGRECIVKDIQAVVNEEK